MCIENSCSSACLESISSTCIVLFAYAISNGQTDFVLQSVKQISFFFFNSKAALAEIRSVQLLLPQLFSPLVILNNKCRGNCSNTVNRLYDANVFVCLFFFSKHHHYTFLPNSVQVKSPSMGSLWCVLFPLDGLTQAN